MKKRHTPTPSPCGSNSSYEACCGRFHRKEAFAPNAEALMRSRYSAFVKKDVEYLLATWHASTRPTDLTLDDPIRWMSLKVVEFVPGETDAFVTFKARGKYSGRAFCQSEKSRFVFEEGAWYYVDGEVDEQ